MNTIRTMRIAHRAAFKITSSVAARPSLLVSRPVRTIPVAFQSTTRFYSTDPQSTTTTTTEQAKPAEEQPVASEQAAEGAAAKPEADLAAQLAEKDKQIAALQDSYRRALADAENVRQRAKKEVAEAKEYAVTKFAKDLIGTADVLEIAINAVPKEELTSNKHLNDLHTGVSMTQSNLVSTFRRFNIEKFNPVDEVFDPNFHEALFQAPIPGKEPNTVFEVAKTGYKIGARVLRPAQVGVVQESS
ncbi:GrpE-domain-containing protein [Phlyctochytrium arcticum]|nr:GrpE-domain-containing protein [Phlyctochytrium arcticum]